MVNILDRKTLRHTAAWFTLGLVLVLTACGGGRQSASAQYGAAATRHSAEQVHAAYLVALRNNNREQVLALTVDDQQAIRADEALRMVQSYMYSTTTTGPYATGGNLSDVRVVKIEDQGTVTHAWSLWQYARKAVCHETALTQTSQGWRVTEFYVSGDSANCTAEP